MDRLQTSSAIPEDSPYRINLTLVAQQRIQAATDHRGNNPAGLVGQCRIPHSTANSMEDLIQEASDEMDRLDEYENKRLWEATTEELAERTAARIRLAEAKSSHE